MTLGCRSILNLLPLALLPSSVAEFVIFFTDFADLVVTLILMVEFFIQEPIVTTKSKIVTTKSSNYYYEKNCYYKIFFIVTTKKFFFKKIGGCQTTLVSFKNCNKEPKVYF